MLEESVRQNSPGAAKAGDAIAISASANIAEAGAAFILKNCFIFVFLV
jgi:hypothetical protein